MELKKGWVSFQSEGAEVTGYLARPAQGEGLPGVLVIQEIWGPDPHIVDVTERLGAAGYAALAVDLYSHGGKPEPLAPERVEQAKEFLNSIPSSAWFDQKEREQRLGALPEPRQREVRETLGALFDPARPIDRYVADLKAGFAYLRNQPFCDGRIGAVGFCLGGGLAALLGCRVPELACAVIFYGASPPEEELEQAHCPFLGHYGELDERINASVPAFEEAANRLGKPLETHTYAGAGHAFFNDTRPSYHPAAARTAWALTLSFLNANTTPAKEVPIR